LVSFRALPCQFVFGRRAADDAIFGVELGLIAGNPGAALGGELAQASGPMDARWLAWIHFLSRPFVTRELAKIPWIKDRDGRRCRWAGGYVLRLRPPPSLACRVKNGQ
jgi:hypothetical protein